LFWTGLQIKSPTGGPTGPTCPNFLRGFFMKKWIPDLSCSCSIGSTYNYWILSSGEVVSGDLYDPESSRFIGARLVSVPAEIVEYLISLDEI
jgi:hypothetical protein